MPDLAPADDESPAVLPEIFPSRRPDTPEYVPASGSLPYGGINWKRDQEASKLAAAGFSMEEIAEKLGMYDTRTGELSPGKAANAVRRAFAAHYRSTTEEMRIQQLASVTEQKRQLWEKLASNEYVLVQQGRVIIHEGTSVKDERLILETHDRILKCEERIAKLMGLDATTRISVEADQIGSEIAELISMINAPAIAAPATPDLPSSQPSTPALPPGDTGA